MNKPPIEHRDWNAQEQALAGAGDRRDALLSRALRTAAASSMPPPGFAADVARRVRLRASAPVDAQLERVLQRVLFVAMALAALVALSIYGAAIVQSLAAALGGGAPQWIMLAGACLALSAWPAGWHQWSRRGDGMPTI